MRDSDAYDAFFSAFLSIYTDQCIMLKKSIDFDPVVVYDICCGTGIFSQAISSIFSQSSIVGIDKNPDSIEIASKKGIDNAEFKVADAIESINFASKQADSLIVVRGAYHFIEKCFDLKRCVGNLSRSSALIIGERSIYSSDSYPVPSCCRKRFNYLTSIGRQSRFLYFEQNDIALRTLSNGEIVSCDTESFIQAVLCRSMSYLEKCAEHELEEWAQISRSSWPKNIDILEEYRYYIYKRA